ncbi:MAG: mechanosensitive ion channel domain-containing protein [Thermoanaerobaculia bacterium]
MSLSNLLETPIFTIGSTETTVGRALVVVAVILATLWLALLARRLTIRHFERYDAGDPVAVKSTASLIATIVVVIGFDIALHILGIRLTALFAAGGVLAFGAGFAAKDIIQNFLSGVILRLDQTIRPGDVIEVHGRWLQIDRLGFRTTVGTTSKGEEVMVPNATVAQSIVTSLTRQNSLYRLETRIGVPYSADLAQVRRTMEETVANLEWRSDQAEPKVYLAELARASVDFDILVWIDDVASAGQRRSDLNEALWRNLKKAEIEITSRSTTSGV